MLEIMKLFWRIIRRYLSFSFGIYYPIEAFCLLMPFSPVSFPITLIQDKEAYAKRYEGGPTIAAPVKKPIKKVSLVSFACCQSPFGAISLAVSSSHDLITDTLSDLSFPVFSFYWSAASYIGQRTCRWRCCWRRVHDSR